jgi:hypothetical protein
VNDSFATAEKVQTVPITVSQIINGNLSAAATCNGTDVDYYQLQVGATGTWNFWLDCYDSNQTLGLGIYNNSQVLLGSATTNPPSAADVPLSLSSGMTVIVKVSGGTGPYSVKILHP